MNENLIKLTKDEMDYIVEVAKQRYAQSRKAGIPNNRVGPQSDFETDLLGYAGEYVLAKMLNIPLDPTPGPARADLITSNGIRLDVKATSYRTGKLIVGKHKAKAAKRCDVYVLVIYLGNGLFKVAGYVWDSEVFDPMWLTRIGNGPEAYVIPQNKLHKFYQ